MKGKEEQVRKYLIVGVLALVVGGAPAVVSALESLGLDDAQTVWVPARFHEDGKPALYIRGERYYGPEGNGVVPGFLRVGDRYLVAVGSAAALDARLSQPLYYYFVDQEGATLEEVGRVPATFEVRVGDHAVYGEQRGLRSQLNFEGVDVEGAPASGPGEILDAVPASGGGWYIFDEYASSGDGQWISIEYESAEAVNTRIMRRTHWHEDDINGFFSTWAAFVDESPLADTVRTGRWTWLHGPGAGNDASAGEYELRFIRLAEVVPGRVRGAPEGEPLIVGSAGDPAEAREWADRTVLFERDGATWAGQWNADGDYGLYQVDGGAPPEYVDAFTGGGEVRALITPRGTLLYMADGSAGYLVDQGRAVDGETLTEALGRYGMVAGD